jgi:hypothetical protein
VKELLCCFCTRDFRFFGWELLVSGARTLCSGDSSGKLRRRAFGTTLPARYTCRICGRSSRNGSWYRSPPPTSPPPRCSAGAGVDQHRWGEHRCTALAAAERACRRHARSTHSWKLNTAGAGSGLEGSATRSAVSWLKAWSSKISGSVGSIDPHMRNRPFARTHQHRLPLTSRNSWFATLLGLACACSISLVLLWLGATCGLPMAVWLDWATIQFRFFGPAARCTWSFCVFGPVLSSPAHGP